jgi:hypothetical protein
MKKSVIDILIKIMPHGSMLETLKFSLTSIKQMFFILDLEIFSNILFSILSSVFDYK